MSTSKLLPGFFKSLLHAASGTLISRVLGLVRDICFAVLIPKGITDLFFVAFRIPNLFRRLFGEGALTVSFVPVFQSIPEQDRSQFFKAFHGILGLLLLGVIGLGVFYADSIIGFLTPGWAASPGKLSEAATLLRWCFPYLGFLALVACYMGVLHAHHRFWVSSVSPALLNVLFLGAIAVKGWGGASISWMSVLIWAVLLGGFFQWAMHIVALRKLKISLWPQFKITPEVRRVFRLMLPSALALSALQLNVLVTSVFASYLPEGTISALYYASRLVEFPLGLIAVSFSVVLLPRLKDGVSEKLSVVWDRTLFLLMPIAVATWILPEVWVGMLFNYGAFDPLLLEQTALALQFGALSILGGGLYRVFSAYSFSDQKPWLPAVLTLGGAGLHCLLSAWWVPHLGLMGIVLSLGLISMLQGVVLILRQCGRFPITIDTLRILGASGILALSLLGLTHLWPNATHWELGLVSLPIGALVYILSLEIFGSDSWKEWKDLLLRRLLKTNS